MATAKLSLSFLKNEHTNQRVCLSYIRSFLGLETTAHNSGYDNERTKCQDEDYVFHGKGNQGLISSRLNSDEESSHKDRDEPSVPKFLEPVISRHIAIEGGGQSSVSVLCCECLPPPNHELLGLQDAFRNMATSTNDEGSWCGVDKFLTR